MNKVSKDSGSPTSDLSNSVLSTHIRKLRKAFLSVGLFSAAVNILMLTGPLFMMQVYDRVLASRSIPTLITLFVLVVGLYSFLGFFDFIRIRILSRIGFMTDNTLMEKAQKRWIYQGLAANNKAIRPATDLQNIRQFLSSNGLPALFDLPWVPVYLAIIFMLHTYLGLLTLAAAFIVTMITITTEYMSKQHTREAAYWDNAEVQASDKAHRNAEAVVAMGMTSWVTSFWIEYRRKAMAHAQKAGGVSEVLTATSKTVRMTAQSGILALGAYLAIFQEITPGTMIAASILAGRALAPVDQVIGNWRNFIRTRLAYKRLQVTLGMDDAGIAQPLQLPEPKGNLSVAGLIKFPTVASEAAAPILNGLQFDLQPGDALGVIGPSASGKSSLARLLSGLWMPDRGQIRLDGATLDQWESDELGRYIGYLPQGVELLGGSVRDNIARFDPEATDEEVVSAAQMAGVHDLILRLPEGYSSEIGNGRILLSGGQAQRIALARAVFRTPKMVILDEPNANLDAEGDAALTRCIIALREAGSTVIVMAHRPSAIAAVNLVLVLQDGQQAAFGPKDETLRQMTRDASESIKSNQGSASGAITIGNVGV